MRQRIVNKIFYSCLNTISLSPLPKLYEAFYKLIEQLEQKTGHFITYHFRPARAEMFKAGDTGMCDYSRIAIVMQGPVVHESDFTIETIRIYKKLFPGCRLVLSTWEDEQNDALKAIEQEGVSLVLSKKPEYFGVQNINLQVLSTKNGVEYAKKLGCQYVLKTRTDQRIYDEQAISLLASLIAIFPVSKGINQNKRLITTNLITLKYRYYGLSDMLMFGDTDDMEDYWNVPLDTRKDIVNNNVVYSMKEHSRLRLGEMYFLTHFLEKKGDELEWSLQHTWQAYRDRFCIIDFNMIGLYWLKYDRRNDNKYNFYPSGNTLQKLTFADWLNIYNGTIKKYPEDILELPMGHSF